MNLEKSTMISDVTEAVTVIETYNLSALVWDFERCPLTELKHYVARGDEELVVVAHKEDKYISFRLILDPGFQHIDFEKYRIILDFHPSYYIYIIISTKDDED